MDKFERAHRVEEKKRNAEAIATIDDGEGFVYRENPDGTIDCVIDGGLDVVYGCARIDPPFYVPASRGRGGRFQSVR